MFTDRCSARYTCAGRWRPFRTPAAVGPGGWRWHRGGGGLCGPADGLRTGRAPRAGQRVARGDESKGAVFCSFFRGFSHLGVLEGLEVCCEGKAPALASVRLKMVTKKRGKFLDSWWLCSRYYLEAEFPLRHCACEGMVPGIRCYSAALGAASQGDVAHWLAEPRIPLEWL